MLWATRILLPRCLGIFFENKDMQDLHDSGGMDFLKTCESHWDWEFGSNRQCQGSECLDIFWQFEPTSFISMSMCFPAGNLIWGTEITGYVWFFQVFARACTFQLHMGCGWSQAPECSGFNFWSQAWCFGMLDLGIHHWFQDDFYVQPYLGNHGFKLTAKWVNMI